MPDNVTAVVGDLTGVVTNLPAVHTVSGGREPEEGWSVSFVPDADAGVSSFLDIVDGRRGYGPTLDNVTYCIRRVRCRL